MNTKIPCVDCICLAMCKNNYVKASNIGRALTKLGNKCSIFKDYITLKDLNLKIPSMSLPMKERDYYNIPQAKRIKEFCSFMKWDLVYNLSLINNILQ